MQKYRKTAVTISLAIVAAVWFVLHANAQTAPEAASPTAQREQQYQRLLDDGADHSKQAEVLLKEQEAELKQQEAVHKADRKRVEAMLGEQENLLARQAKYVTRYEKILDTWESQQKEYQRYLDTLPKK
jgi:hypothetical protein